MVTAFLSQQGSAAVNSKLYDAGFVTSVRSSGTVDQFVFVRGNCCAEMKKSVAYMVDIKQSCAGDILECRCECAAGVGPAANCKRVYAILFALHDLTVHKKLKLPLKLTCTQKLQSFHHKVKQFHGSPLKAGKFGSIISPNTSGKKTVFDPRPDTKPTVQNYQNFVRNLTVNYKAYHPGSMPLAQLYSPANIHALESDHDYCECTLSDLFLNEIGVTTICQELATSIEEKTRGQYANPKWFAERCVRLHASCYKRICKAQDKAKLDRHTCQCEKTTTCRLTMRHMLACC